MKITWRYHDTTLKRVRWWLDEWAGDQFEVCDDSKFRILASAFQQAGIRVDHAEDDEISSHNFLNDPLQVSTGNCEAENCWITVVSVKLTVESPLELGIGIGKYPGTADIDTIITWSEEKGMWSNVASEVYWYELRQLHGCISIPASVVRNLGR